MGTLTAMSAARTQPRVDAGPLLVGAGALLLLVSLFVDWYAGSISITGWTAFELIDILLALIALGALYEAANVLVRPGWPRAPWIWPIAGPLALVLVLVSIINKPPVAIGEVDLEIGVWLALVGAVLMTIGPRLGRLRIAVAVDDSGPRREAATPAARTDPDAETKPLP